MTRRALTAVRCLLAGAPMLTTSGCGRECDVGRPPSFDADTATADRPPQLVSGRFVDPATVELAFTHAIAPVDGVDPAKFRLSMTMVQGYRARGVCSGYTDYYDLADGFAWCNDGYDLCPPPTRVLDVSNDASDPTLLRLGISPPLDPYRCLELEYADDDGIDAAIFVHYSHRVAPTITDTQGRQLEDIAPHWVLSGERRTYRNGALEAAEFWRPIPCPPGF